MSLWFNTLKEAFGKFMLYAVYIDMPRQLTAQERLAVADALEAQVPSGGCVGLQKGPNDEVYFDVEAPSDKEAEALAARYISLVFQAAELDEEYTISLQTTDGGFRNWTSHFLNS